MPIPQVTDRLKEAPAVVLRAVFAGIGQLLMAVDKIRAQMQEQAAPPATTGQKGPGTAEPPRPAAETDNVTQLRERATSSATRPVAEHADGAAVRPTPAGARVPAPKPAAPKPAAAPRPATPATRPAARTRPAAAPKPADSPKPATAKPATATATSPTAPPPIPGYDDLSIASLRARLRGLDVASVNALLAYEKAHARRDDVVTMFERRLTKIGDEAG